MPQAALPRDRPRAPPRRAASPAVARERRGPRPRPRRESGPAPPAGHGSRRTDRRRGGKPAPPNPPRRRRPCVGCLRYRRRARSRNTPGESRCRRPGPCALASGASRIPSKGPRCVDPLRAKGPPPCMPAAPRRQPVPPPLGAGSPVGDRLRWTAVDPTTPSAASRGRGSARSPLAGVGPALRDGTGAGPGTGRVGHRRVLGGLADHQRQRAGGGPPRRGDLAPAALRSPVRAGEPVPRGRGHAGEGRL